jgi:hypothetical protein
MSSINKQPAGLLDFFGIKNGGRNPVELRNDVTGQIPLLDLYESASEIVQGTSTGNVAAGVTLFGPAGVVSDTGTTWHFQSYSLRINTTVAAAFAYCRLGIAYNGVFHGLTETMYGNEANLVLGFPGQISVAVRDLWLPASWSLAFECNGLGVPAVPFDTEWRGTRYRW